MVRFYSFLFLVFSGFLAPHFVFASVVVNEVLFDPADTDTGLEKIELYNPDAAGADLSGWELYPDGIGYFTFPSVFSLSPKAFVAIHLRTSGMSDAVNLYHPGVTSNLGNSSGSIALFKPGGRSKDTIVDFVRYHTPGGAERKTWESAAAEAGLWQAGAFVDTSSLAEGNSIGLTSDGGRGGIASWKIYAAPTIGTANIGTAVTPLPPAAAASPPLPPPPPGGAPPPPLRVEAGNDLTVLAGAVVPFRGKVFAPNGELIENARMLWNFGDGSFREGKAVTHIYHFPGTYIASLHGSSGEYTGSDYLTVRVLAPDIRITEVKPGADGFVELWNATGERLDLGGLILADAAGTTFRTPQGTLIERGAAVAFPNATTGLSPLPRVLLRDAQEKVLDEFAFSGELKPGESLELVGGRFAPMSPPTPGSYGGDRPTASGALASPTPELSSRRPEARGSPPEASGIPPAPPAPVAPEGVNPTLPTTSRAVARTGALSLTPQVFLAASLLLGLAAAVGFVAVKRKFP